MTKVERGDGVSVGGAGRAYRLPCTNRASFLIFFASTIS